jgi:hypothetical protein
MTHNRTGSARRAVIAVLAASLLAAAYAFSFIYAQAKPSPQGHPSAPTPDAGQIGAD